MGKRDRTGKVVAAGILLWVAAMLLVITTAALAHRRVDDVWMDGLIRRVEPQFREIMLWDYRGGISTWVLQVPGAVQLNDLQVGDLVRVRLDRNMRVVLRLYKLAPPKGDDTYWEAIRRLEAETESSAP